MRVATFFYCFRSGKTGARPRANGPRPPTQALHPPSCRFLVQFFTTCTIFSYLFEKMLPASAGSTFLQIDPHHVSVKPFIRTSFSLQVLGPSQAQSLRTVTERYLRRSRAVLPRVLWVLRVIIAAAAQARADTLLPHRLICLRVKQSRWICRPQLWVCRLFSPFLHGPKGGRCAGWGAWGGNYKHHLSLSESDWLRLVLIIPL